MECPVAECARCATPRGCRSGTFRTRHVPMGRDATVSFGPRAGIRDRLRREHLVHRLDAGTRAVVRLRPTRPGHTVPATGPSGGDRSSFRHRYFVRLHHPSHASWRRLVSPLVMRNHGSMSCSMASRAASGNLSISGRFRSRRDASSSVTQRSTAISAFSSA